MPHPRSRHSNSATCLAAALPVLLSACAGSLPTHTSAIRASTAISIPDDAIVGDWMMAITEEGDLPTRLMLHVSTSADGKLQGRYDDLSTPEKDKPLTGVAFEQGLATFSLDGAVVDGTLNPDHNRIEGSLKPTGTINRLLIHFFTDRSEFPVVMARIDPARPPVRLQSHDYTIGGHHLHYLEVAGSSAARVVFIHGSPGEADNWNPYLTDPDLHRRATLIAVDRPGFGESDPGRIVTDLREQARLLEPLLREHLPEGDVKGPAPDASCLHVPTIIVGWSEGGPIAAEMAMDYPREISTALLEAPAIDPEHDGRQWYNYAAALWPVSKLVSAVLGDGMMRSNDEMMALDPQLESQLPRWKTLSVPMVVIQGEADDLVDPRTADFARRELPSSDWILRVPGVGHGVPFTNTAMAALDMTLSDLTGGQGTVAKLP